MYTHGRAQSDDFRYGPPLKSKILGEFLEKELDFHLFLENSL
ncbi:hypothetical protein LEP1GSC188_0354 [Leptospira weilii serovar Topaz str. LT2116]|uniref:Uncharacterized protein n=1 Tax=Leptospira weilii serovar Topaz str. LT2116 TaxID=1088540 RepID=M3H0J8_9LEPT|nr:hypothetical protein LEP1GSC188_0354 [Leptospira weilii serovar Topaz str. LT2116]